MPITASEDSAVSYLECLDALRLEISIAIGAMASNSPARLKESVSNQEALCSRLEILAAADLSQRRGNCGPVAAAARLAVDGEIRESEIRESWRRLHARILEYAALLRHSGESVALLTSLCRSHRYGAEGCRRNSLGEA